MLSVNYNYYDNHCTCTLNYVTACYSCWIAVSDYKGGALWAFVVPFGIVIVVCEYIKMKN